MAVTQTPGEELHESMRADDSERKRRDIQRSRSAVGQVRRILADRVVVSSTLDPFLSLRALASYACVSVRKLPEHLEDANHPLPHYRVGGKIVVRRSEFDAWMAAYRRVGRADIGEIVDSVMRDSSPASIPGGHDRSRCCHTGWPRS
jgi:hypothetical protein